MSPHDAISLNADRLDWRRYTQRPSASSLLAPSPPVGLERIPVWNDLTLCLTPVPGPPFSVHAERGPEEERVTW